MVFGCFEKMFIVCGVVVHIYLCICLPRGINIKLIEWNLFWGILDDSMAHLMSRCIPFTCLSRA